MHVRAYAFDRRFDDDDTTRKAPQRGRYEAFSDVFDEEAPLPAMEPAPLRGDVEPAPAAVEPPPVPEDDPDAEDLGSFFDDLPPKSETAVDVEAVRSEGFEAGRDAGYAQGFADGRREVAEGQEARAVEAIAAIAEGLPSAQSQLDALLERAERRATRLALAVIRRVAPALDEALAQDHAAAIVKEAVHAGRAAPELTVRLSPELAAALEPRIESIRDAAAGKTVLHVEVEESAGPGAVKVLWETGGVEYDVSSASKAIEDLIAHAEEATARAAWETP